jgi:hypothetical protein
MAQMARDLCSLTHWLLQRAMHAGVSVKTIGSFRQRMQSTDIPLRAGSSLLLREITHRVCNEYAAVISSISRAAARATSEEAKLARIGVASFEIAFTPSASG